MKKHCLVLSIIMTAILFSISACKKNDDLYSKENPVSITVWNYYNGEQIESFNSLVEKFNKGKGAEKGIHVECFSQGTVNDLERNVISAVEGKVGAYDVPNIFSAYPDTAYYVDNMGVLVDLSQYLTEGELDLYVDSYIDEGRFNNSEEVKIFPVAKSLEIFLLNKTDWDKFAEETGATYDDLKTIEGVTKIAEEYYNWTDSKTLEPNDGRAFFGRDAMANYILIGAKELGVDIFNVENGNMTLNLDKEVMRKLWDNYYVPFIKGYFAKIGKFRSDDIKIGNVISFVGSSSGATFFPKQVILSDTESYPILMEALPNPKFSDGEDYAIQQGAGMVVTKGSDAEIKASIEFLKWFTSIENNIEFSTQSGYLPVLKEANNIEVIEKYNSEIDNIMDKILGQAIDTVNSNKLYTTNAFENGTGARVILEHCMSDIADKDRGIVVERLKNGFTLEEASAEFLTDEYFDTWYNNLLSELKEFQYK